VLGQLEASWYSDGLGGLVLGSGTDTGHRPKHKKWQGADPGKVRTQENLSIGSKSRGGNVGGLQPGSQ
jgi:hypothetical protein